MHPSTIPVTVESITDDSRDQRFRPALACILGTAACILANRIVPYEYCYIALSHTKTG